jgi:hypothetical protein
LISEDDFEAASINYPGCRNGILLRGDRLR